MKWAYSDIYLYLWNAKPSRHQQGPRATFKMFWFVIQIQIQCIAITSILAFRFQRVPESSKLRAPNSGFSQCVKTHSFWRGGLSFLSFHSSLNVVFYNVPSKLEQNIFVPKLSYKPNLASVSQWLIIRMCAPWYWPLSIAEEQSFLPMDRIVSNCIRYVMIYTPHELRFLISASLNLFLTIN